MPPHEGRCKLNFKGSFYQYKPSTSFDWLDSLEDFLLFLFASTFHYNQKEAEVLDV